jgi:undecaprenyl-diphosphatase
VDVIGDRRLGAARDGAIAAAFAFVAALARLPDDAAAARVSFTPYVIYRVILGVVLLWIAYA